MGVWHAAKWLLFPVEPGPTPTPGVSPIPGPLPDWASHGARVRLRDRLPLLSARGVLDTTLAKGETGRLVARPSDAGLFVAFDSENPGLDATWEYGGTITIRELSSLDTLEPCDPLPDLHNSDEVERWLEQ